MAAALTLYRNNASRLKVTLKNLDTGAWINTALLVRCVSLKHADGSAVVGQAFPIDLGYVLGSNGEYRAALDETLVVTEHEILTALITYDADGANTGEVEPNIVVRRRRAT